MAGVIDGQPVSAAVTNPAFIIKNADDTMPNKLSFTDPGEGASIGSIQKATNTLYTATGASESQTGTVYSAPANTITDGENHQNALAALAAKFDAILGHKHTGTAGDAPPVAATSFTVPYLGMILEGTDLVSVTGSSSDVSSQLNGQPVSNFANELGVVVSTPYNKAIVRDSSNDDEFIDSTGNVVYGRVTNLGGATGTWTLSYYSEISGTETAYSFAAATGVRFYYQEIYNPLTVSGFPTYSQLARVPVSRSLHSISASGSPPLFGDVELDAGANITLSQSGQKITIGASGGGGGSLNTATKTTNYTLQNTDDVILLDASGGAFTLSLLAVASATKKPFYLKKIDASGNAITIDGNASELIDDELTQALNVQMQAIAIITDGSNWYVF